MVKKKKKSRRELPMGKVTALLTLEVALPIIS
jgi:hypothetical protein